MATHFQPKGTAIVSENGTGVCNRPIFCANSPTSILTGERPLVRLIRYNTLLGTLRFWIKHRGGVVYIDSFEQVSFSYQANLTTWVLRDPRCPAVLKLSIGSPEKTEGFVLRAEASSPVTVGWEFGGMHVFGEESWNLNASVVTDLQNPAMDPAWEEGNLLDREGDTFTVELGEEKVYVKHSEGSASQLHLSRIRGMLILTEKPAYFGASRSPLGDLCSAYESVLARHRKLENIFVSHTPDPYLDAQMAVLGSEIDGAWYGQYTVHSNQSWNSPYLGWCNRFGNALGGWFDRAKSELAYYCARMTTVSNKQGGQSDPALRHTEAGPKSRFYGVGHIDEHQFMYNMQSQFFDQAIFAWRMTGDSTMAMLLRDALEYHTLWQDECFDPDNDGLYESYINTWPTDSVWYNGGGSCEETCYAYRAHQAAMELAMAAGDEAAFAKHHARVALIRKGFFEKLWLQDAGYPAAYVEEGGHGRAHRSAWLYNSFMPVDMDLTDPFEAAMCVDYSRWALENVAEPAGGRSVWLSNWVPEIWSVRQNTAGENFQLAYAYAKAGFAGDSYDLLCGSIRRRGFSSKALGHDGYDYGQPGHICSEAASLLARAVICGLHGYRPDYPNNRVTLSPQYPQEWNDASFATSYFSCEFHRTGRQLNYRFSLPRTADVTLRLPICAERVKMVIGASNWEYEPGFGFRVLKIELSQTDGAEIVVMLDEMFEPIQPIDLCCAPGDTLQIASDTAATLRDPQGILADFSIEDGKATVRLRDDIDGAHMLFLGCAHGDAIYWQIVRLKISPTAEKQEQKRRTQVEIAGKEMLPLDLSGVLHSDIRTIFQQEYLDERDHVHLSIGSDGYSPWTFAHWQNPLPDIRVKYENETVMSDSGFPFRIGSKTENVAFTSLYKNWPDAVTVPVGMEAEAIGVLCCGSTNPMQIGIANAVLRFTYEDGTEDKLELVNPDNYWMISPYTCQPSDKTQSTINDYCYETSAFCLPETPPPMLKLGKNCRAMVLGYTLQPGKVLREVTLETLSQEVVVGLMAITLVGAKEKAPNAE